MVTNCTDSFQRANTAGNGTVSNVAGWGTSSDGNTWQQQTAGAPTFSINGNAGRVSGITIDTIVALGSTNYADNEVTGRMQVSSNASGDNWGLVLRFTDSKHVYFCSVAPGSPATIAIIMRNSSAVDVTLASANGVNTSANTNYQLRFKVVGSALSAKMWLDGQPEPSAFQVTASDSTYANGLPGVYFSPDLVGTTQKIDQFNCHNLNPPSGGIIGGPQGILTATMYS